MTTSGSGPRPPRRTGLGARTPTSRPRKVAGRGAGVPDGGPEGTAEVSAPDVAAPLEPEAPPEVLPEASPEASAGASPEASRRVGSAAPDEDHEPQPAWPDEEHLPSPGFRRVTAALVAVIVLLVGVAAGLSWYLWGQDDPVVSAQRPVVTGKVTHTSAVDDAAKALVDIVSASYQSYDDQVELAASRMTDAFAADFRTTKADVKKDFIAQKTEVTAEVAGQGVVQASAEQVVALVFLDQSTTKDGGNLNVAQYKILVTVVRTDAGWLVSDVQTL